MCDCRDCNEKPKYIHKAFISETSGGKVCQGCYEGLLESDKNEPEDFERIN